MQWKANFRGAKVALYVTLTQPDLPKAVISMENAPISGRLSPTFKQYVKAMKGILDADLTKRKDAEDMLEKYEPVDPIITKSLISRIKEFDNF